MRPPPAEALPPGRRQRRRARQLQQRQRREEREMLTDLARRAAGDWPARDEGPPPRID